MTLIVDASPLIAVLGGADPRRQAILGALVDEPGALIVPPPVVAEVDYFAGRYFGASGRRAFVQELATGRFDVPHLEREDYAAISEVDLRYADLDLGLADCSMVLLAHRYDTTRILTFDERHFRAVAPVGGGAFTLLPTDA